MVYRAVYEYNESQFRHNPDQAVFTTNLSARNISLVFCSSRSRNDIAEDRTFGWEIQNKFGAKPKTGSHRNIWCAIPHEGLVKVTTEGLIFNEPNKCDRNISCT